MLNAMKHLPGFSTNPQEILRFAQDDKIKEAQDDKIKEAQDDIIKEAQDDIIKEAQDDIKSLLYSNK